MARGTPSFADLFLAFRQAKKAIATEPAGVGLFNLARFEMRLATRLRRLQKILADDRWFDRIDIGRLVVIPKGTETLSPRADVVSIGIDLPTKVELNVRLQLQPSPEFSITEVLYLWEFGSALEALLHPRRCLGYRLKNVRDDGVMSRSASEVYDPWWPAFDRYRNEPIKRARTALDQGKRVVITSTDVVSFFDSIDPAFLLERAFISELREAALRHARPFSVSRYRSATESLLRRFQAFRELQRSASGDASVGTGVPIGALTSRVFANVALSSLDKHITELPEVLIYRRYVDDIVVVSEWNSKFGEPTSKVSVLRHLFPDFTEGRPNHRFVVPTTRGTFELKDVKTRVHDLTGSAGKDFLAAVRRSFSAVTSERRAFLGNVSRLEEELEVSDLFSDGDVGTDHIPRLRDADNFTLRRFMANALVKDLRRVALLLDESVATAFMEERTERILSVLNNGVKLDDFEFVLKLLKIAYLCNCLTVASQLTTWLEERAGDELFERVRKISWRAQDLPRNRTLRLLQAYLKQRIDEGTATAAPLRVSELSIRPAKAWQLRRTGLRYLDREDDVSVFGYLKTEIPRATEREHSLTKKRLIVDREADRLLRRVRLFMDQSNRLGEKVWRDMTDVAVFLSARPPSYMDVARRFLARAEAGPVVPEIGKQIEECVDALRGTRYSRRKIPAVALEIAGDIAVLRVEPRSEPEIVRVILSNLPVQLAEFDAAASGQPLHTLERLQRLSSTLREAQRASREAEVKGLPSILLLPELSIPRRWLRALAQHAVTEGLSIVAGVEYENTHSGLINQAIGVFPDRWKSAAMVSWTKRNPAREEEAHLQPPLPSFATIGSPMRRLVADSRHGRFGVLICSEIMEPDALSVLAGNVEILLVPSWNRDTSSFEHVAHASASLLVHAFVCIANNALASDSRIVAPIKEPHYERDWCRLIHRDENRIIWGDLPVSELRDLHDGNSVTATTPAPKEALPHRQYRPFPPGWKPK